PSSRSRTCGHAEPRQTSRIHSDPNIHAINTMYTTPVVTLAMELSRSVFAPATCSLAVLFVAPATQPNANVDDIGGYRGLGDFAHRPAQHDPSKVLTGG